MTEHIKALYWLRNDLRSLDNPALTTAIANGCKHAIFLATPQQWQIHDQAPIKIDFIRRHVALMQKQLAELGIELHVATVSNFAEQVDYIADFASTNNINQIYANDEVEFNEQRRDQTLAQRLSEYQCQLKLFESGSIIPKGVLLNQQGEMFKVFTPFKKAWLKHLKSNIQIVNSLSITGSITAQPFAETKSNNERQIFDYPNADSSRWPLADTVINQVYPHFLANKVAQYHQERDLPAVKATSGLSPYLAIGAISPKYLVSELLKLHPYTLDEPESGAFCWLNELIWRDFYRHLLHHFPNLCKRQNFKSQYDHLPWPNNTTLFKAWCKGRTGFPIIDAAMRQLTTTGWMHNRLRMITASFLTKHLLVDWRLGERFFMQHLIDGDLAANNGGWQWSAGTGCDAQPYFRIFNPVSQSKKFDPEGDFIRKYLPQLTNLSARDIHQIDPRVVDTIDYWPEIVDLKQARAQALNFYRS